MTYYKLEGIFKDILFLVDFLGKLRLDDLIDVIIIIEKLFVNTERDSFIDLAKNVICEEIESYCTDVPAECYEIDINGIVNSYRYWGEINKYEIEDAVKQEVSDLVKNEVEDYTAMLPEDIKIEKDFLDNVDISINGAGALVDDYFADIDYDPELLYDRDFVDNDDEIDLIFNRTILE